MSVWMKILHWGIIINFLQQIGYGFYMVFFVAGGGGGPLFGRAGSLTFEEMMTRRMYAMETWVPIVGLSIYLGVTVMLPRLLKDMMKSA